MAKHGRPAHEWGQLADAVGPRVRLLRNALAARSIAALEEFGLPTGSLTVLSLVAANPGSSQTVLAKAAGLNKSALVGIVDELERRGLAARGRSASDRRRNQLTVTADGEAAMKAMFWKAETTRALGSWAAASCAAEFPSTLRATAPMPC